MLPCLATGFIILVDFLFALVSLDESLPTLTGGALAGSDRLRGDSGVEGGDDGAYSDLYGSTVDGGIEGEQDLSGFSPAPASKSTKQQSPMSKLLSSRSFLVTVSSAPIDQQCATTMCDQAPTLTIVRRSIHPTLVLRILPIRLRLHVVQRGHSNLGTRLDRHGRRGILYGGDRRGAVHGRHLYPCRRNRSLPDHLRAVRRG